MTSYNFSLAKFGPGLLLAATAIGVSHIVQSVQAGGKYGLILILAVLFSHLIKYPFFLTAPKYSSHTKQSLLQGYFEIHHSLLVLFLILTIASMFSLQAVVTLITAAVFNNIIPFDISVGQLSTIVLLFCALVLFIGRYHFLDKIIKPIILILFIATIIALGYAIFDPEITTNSSKASFDITNKVDFLFLIAFIGWMPCPLDCVVWNSIWTVRKQEDSNNHYSFLDAKLDFKVGYIIACFLAIVFLCLGYFIFYKNNIPLDNHAVPFIGKFLSIYTDKFGQIAFDVIAIAALLTMFSTTITCLDGFPRVLSKSINILNKHYRNAEYNEHKLYNYFLLFTVVGTSFVLLFLLTSMQQIIMVATLTSFVSTAILTILHQIINKRLSAKFAECKMSKPAIIYSNICVLIMILLSIILIYTLF